MTQFRILNSYPRSSSRVVQAAFSDRDSELSIKYWSDPLSSLMNHQSIFGFLRDSFYFTANTQTAPP